MTREEMIRKVLDASQDPVSNTYDKYYLCGFCGVESSKTGDDFPHKKDCESRLSKQLLAEPVIEVGDVVKIQESDDEYYVCRIVQEYGYSYPWYELSKESPWSEHTKKHNNLTLIRKGSHVSND